MNKIRKILSVIPILSCICVLSLTTHAAENQNKNYLSDLRAYAGVESKENIIKDYEDFKKNARSDARSSYDDGTWCNINGKGNNVYCKNLFTDSNEKC